MHQKPHNDSPGQAKKLASDTAIQQQLQHALKLHVNGQLADASLIYEDVLRLQPMHVQCLHLLGVASYQNNDLVRAVDLIGRAIELHPKNAIFYANRGLALKGLQRIDEALSHQEMAITLKPDFADAYNYRGSLLMGLERFEQAIESLDKAIQLNPAYAEAMFNRGMALGSLGQLDAAVASFCCAIEIKPDYVEAHFNCGRALRRLNQLQTSIARFDSAIRLNPRHVHAYNNWGRVLVDLNEPQAALEKFTLAVEISPDFSTAHYNRGTVYRSLGEHGAAIACFSRAIELDPNNANIYNDLGLTYTSLKQFDAALSSFDRAIAIRADFAFAHNNRGTVLHALKKFPDAIASFDLALQNDPNYANAHYNRGLAHYGLKQQSAAILCYDNAIAILPNHAEAYNAKGNCLLELNRIGDAISGYQRALAIRPDFEYVPGILAHTRMLQCQWANFNSDTSEIIERILRRGKASMPFPLLGLIDDPIAHRRAAEIQVEDRFPESDVLGPIPLHGNHSKIRIAYYSADFRNHPVSHLIIGLFEAHDKSKFETIGFSFGPAIHDEMRQRVSATFDKFIDVSAMSDLAVAQLSRDEGIDIAVDLMGHTQDSRMGIFAARCAPIQVNYLGYPGTTGAPYIDYIIADEHVIPRPDFCNYVEKVAYLPGSYLVNDSNRPISEKVFTRQDCGLPDAGFVFCCFNNNYKITPLTFEIWMRILQNAPGSVLWLRKESAEAAANLRKHAQASGVDSSRLIFAERVPHPSDHLARLRVADLFLDTLPYNAHVTAADALWAGLPVLTQTGNSFAGRVASSLLGAIGLDELITQSAEQYEIVAVDLANNPQKLIKLRATLAANRDKCPLFDTAKYARSIEELFSVMVQHHAQGLSADHLIYS